MEAHLSKSKFISKGQAWSISKTDALFASVTLALLSLQVAAMLAGNITALLFVLQHLMVLLFLLTHRPPANDPIAWPDLLWAWAGTLLLLLMRPSPMPLDLRMTGGLLLFCGVLFSLAGLLSLGRSFGMEPALRGVQTHGLYRIVRHPMYASYLLVAIGYLLANCSAWNSAVALLWLTAQVVRIRREEALLGMDPGYMRYKQKVRWRLVPFVW